MSKVETAQMVISLTVVTAFLYFLFISAPYSPAQILVY